MSLPTWTEAATRQPRQSVDMSNSKVYDRVGSKERHQSQHNHRDLENTNPQRSPSHRREDDFADNSRTSYSRVNILDSSGYDKFDARSGRDIEEIFDAFKYREVCLNSSAKTKLVANFLNKIKDHINKEACLEAETANGFAAPLEDPESNPFRSKYSFAASIAVPREVQMLDTCSSELRAAAQACIKAVVECFDSRKTIYLTQLKKIRETSNMATRNAVQHERSEASIFINRLRESLEAQRRQEVSDAQARVSDLDTLVAQLRATIEANRAEIDRLLLLDQNRLALQQTAVVEAVRQTREETRQERTTLQETAAAEHRRLQAEAQATVDDMKRQLESRIATQKEHDQELRAILVQDKERVEAEVLKMREELINTVAKLTSEKERSVARLVEERERAERDQSAALAEAVKGQATLRAEMAAILQRAKNEEQKRTIEQETSLTKYREQVLVQHSMEIEKLHDRHRKEIQKYQAEMQVRNQDAVFKLKHIHEQELKRLNHENDRLTSLVVRLGGSTQLRNPNSSTYNNNPFQEPSLLASRGDSLAEVSFHQANSPGMRFGSPSPTSSSTKAGSSKAPIYSSRIRESLTPPGKFHQRSSNAEAHASRNGNTGSNTRAEMESPPPFQSHTGRPSSTHSASRDGNNGHPNEGNGAARSHQQHLQDRLANSKRASFESGTRLSSKYAEPSAPAENSFSEKTSTKSLRVPESPPPPAPKSVKSVLNWGALHDSLTQQENNDKPKFSASHLPPDAFPLNESLSAVKSARNGKMGIGIEENAIRTMKYTNEMDNYLTNNGGRGSSQLQDESLDHLSVLHQLPATAHVLDSSSHSSLNFNAQAATKYMEARERHGLNPKSRTYDSDSDGHSEDSLYGEEIAVNTTNNTSRSGDFISP